VSNIGPNFRPPGQQQPAVSRPSGNQGAPPASTGQTTSGLPQQPALGGTLPAPMGLGALFAHENVLSAQQLMQVLRNLLQMPRELVQLLAMMADLDPKMGRELLQKLLAEDAQVPSETLQAFLQEHLDSAQDKLLKLMQSGPTSLAGSGKQMGDLMGTLTELVSKAGKSPSDALHSTISLYLPYYPLHPPQAFSLRFESKPGGDGEGDGQEDEDTGGQDGDASQLALFIQTKTLGQFKISLSVERPARLLAVIEHDAQAAPFEADIRAQVKEAMGTGNTQSIELLFIARSGAKGTGTQGQTSNPSETSNPEPDQQSVGIHPTGGVSAAAIHGAYLLIRVILELDNRNGLHQTRSQSLYQRRLFIPLHPGSIQTPGQPF